MPPPIEPTPLRKQLVSFPTPSVADRVLKERHDANQRAYVVPEYGTAHPNVRLYPNHVLALVRPVVDDSGWAEWFWVNERANQDAYNYVIDYPYGLTEYPRYIRTYVLLQASAEEPVAGTPDSVYTDFVLVEHQHKVMEDPVIASLFITTVRAFELLPGPWLPFTRYDDLLGPIQGRKRPVENTGQIPSLTATTKTSYEAKELSAFVSWETEEVWSNGTGSGTGNDVFPTGVKDFYDDAKGAVQQATTLVVATGSEVGSIAIAGGILTEISYDPFNQFLLKKVTETWAIPGPAQAGQVLTNEQQVGTLTKRLVVGAGAVVADTATIESSEVKPINALVSEKTTVEVPEVFGHTVYSAEIVDVIPAKFRVGVAETTTASTVAGTVSAVSVGGGVISASQEQLTSHKKRVTTKTRGSIAGTTLTGKKNYVMRTTGTVTETYSTGSQTADSGINVDESVVTPLGEGSVKTTVTVGGHLVLTGFRWDKELQAPIKYTEQFVAPLTSGTDFTDVQIVNEDRALKRVEVVPTAKLDAFMRVYPTRANIPLPDELQEVTVNWNRDVAEGSASSSSSSDATGESGTVGGTISSEANSSGALIPELSFKIKQFWGKNVPTKTYFFYLKNENADDDHILTKLGVGVQLWPLFKPEGHVIALMGTKVSVRHNSSLGHTESWSKTTRSTTDSNGDGSSYDINISNRSVVIPPTLHKKLKFDGLGDDKLSVTATSFTSLSIVGAGGLSAPATKEISAKVSPSSLAATSPDSVPVSGKYLIDVRVMDADFGYCRVMAEVLDASVLA